jgi:hypothetical protein
MKMKFVLLSVVLSLGVFACGQTVNSTASNRQDLSALNAQQEPPMLGIHYGVSRLLPGFTAQGITPT